MIQAGILKQQLSQKLNIPEDKIQILRPRRLAFEIEYGRFAAALKILTDDLKFNVLCAMTGLDEADKLSVIYHLAQENGTVLNFKTSVDKVNPVIKTITPVFSSAEVYERELVDLLGFIVEGLPEGPRYPLTDDWPLDEHPLRKDWKPKQ
jgi:NADH:ubiquinone oxidoreductase subunit C